MNEIKLKPCPFCGGAARLKSGSDASYVQIFGQCTVCGAIGAKRYIEPGLASTTFTWEQEAADLWNRRTEK